MAHLAASPQVRQDAAVRWKVSGGSLGYERHPLVMAVVNVTPDSFSDGGDHLDTGKAIARGMELADQGAEIVDVGGESTRPSAAEVDVAEELQRTIPVVVELAAAGVVVSIDTSKPAVAEAAIAAGARILNDVTALADPVMASVAADSGVGVVLMHMLGSPRTMQRDPRYRDVVAEVGSFLERRAEAAIAAGVDPEAVCIDPGIGFGKTVDHNLALLANLDIFVGMGWPVLVGASRKSFLGELTGIADPALRDPATAATTALAAAQGAAVVRVHDAAGALAVARVAGAIVGARRY